MKYEIEIADGIVPVGMTPARLAVPSVGEPVLWAAGTWGTFGINDQKRLHLILEPVPATPEFDPGTFWRWDCHQDGLKPSIVRIATKEESATNCISPRAYEAAVIFPDGLAFIVYRSSLTPWVPQAGERVFHRSLCIYGEVTDVGPTTTSVRWENGDFGQPPTDRLIPAAFAPKLEQAKELHKFCPYCGKVADDFFWVCAECAEESMGNFPTAHGEIQPSASPPSPLLPKPWAKEQPPTIPDGWELAEPQKRLPRKDDWCFFDGLKSPTQAARDHTLEPDNTFWIVRRKPAPVEIDIEQLTSIFATAESGLGTIAGLFGTLSEQLRKVAEGQATK